MQFSYYPGCSMDTTGITYKLSIEYICSKIGLVLHEIPDWNCCGATAAHSKNKMLALALPARNLAQAEEEGLDLDVAVPCASCFSRPEMKRACQEKMYRTLKGMKVACYYGCLTSRPVEVTGASSTENPMEMDEIVALTGAEPVAWDFKTECCGASHQVDAPRAARPLIERIIRNAKANGAQAIITACPLCNLNLDMREGEINKAKGTRYDLPVYQFTELLAVCMGAGAKDIGIHKHFFPAFDLLNEYLRKAGD